MTEPRIRPGSHLALAQEAVMERVADDPRTVDWFGVARALSDASMRDVQERRERAS